MMDTMSKASPGLKTIGTSGSQNTSNIYSRKEFKKDGYNTLVGDKVYDAIVSQKKSMSHIGQEEGQKIVDTPPTAAPGLKKLALRDHRILSIHSLKKSTKRTAPTSQSAIREMMLLHHIRNTCHILAKNRGKQ